MFFNLTNTRLLEYLPEIILPAIGSTLVMLFFSMLLGFVIGTVVAVVLVTTSPFGLKPNSKIYKTVGFAVNMIRSFPVIILIVAISPLTRALVGTSIGEKAAIVPLTLAAFPVIARYMEASLLEVDRNVILAARSFGASNSQIMFKVLFSEALPSIVSGLTTTTILFLASTTLAGAVGAGAAAIPELCARTDPAATGRAGGGACGLGGTRRHSDALAADDDAQERAPR